MIEREVKLSFPSADAARTAILAAGATASHARRLQDDTLYDTPDGMLKKKGCIVRIRTERWPDGSVTARLTFKGPVQPGTMKIREEHETGVEKPEALTRTLDALGLLPSFRYQKYREEFSSADLVVAIDQTPVGTFVELEGGEAAILSMSAALGRSPDDFILQSYYGLFQTRRNEFGLEGPHMVFSGTE